MELRIALDHADLQRFRAQPILKSFRRGLPRNSSENGEILDEDHRFTFRLLRSHYALGGNGWNASLCVEHGEIAHDGITRPFCFADFRLIEGSGAPLCALIQALADAVPLTVSRADLLSVGRQLLPGQPSLPVKSKPPPLRGEIDSGTALRAIAGTGLAHLIVNHDCLLQTGDPEAIHQMRVALRRLRSAMGLFREMLDDPASQALRGELRWLQQTLGSARDWDVLLGEMILPLQATFGEEPGYRPLCDAIVALRQTARNKALRELATPRLSKLLLQLAFWAELAGAGHPLANRPLRQLARATLEKRHRRVRKHMVLFDELDDAGRHQCRIDIKKLRYALDFFAGLFPARRVQRLITLLASLQDRLGMLNDIATARAKLETLVLQQGSPDMAWAAGLLVGWHGSRTGLLLAQVQEDWRAAEKVPLFWQDHGTIGIT